MARSQADKARRTRGSPGQFRRDGGWASSGHDDPGHRHPLTPGQRVRDGPPSRSSPTAAARLPRRDQPAVGTELYRRQNNAVDLDPSLSVAAQFSSSRNCSSEDGLLVIPFSGSAPDALVYAAVLAEFRDLPGGVALRLGDRVTVRTWRRC